MKKIKRILRSERREEKLRKKGLVWSVFGYWFREEKEKERKVKISIIGAKRETEIQMIDFRRCCVCFVIYKVVVSVI
jgi:hypothetical protein